MVHSDLLEHVADLFPPPGVRNGERDSKRDEELVEEIQELHQWHSTIQQLDQSMDKTAEPVQEHHRTVDQLQRAVATLAARTLAGWAQYPSFQLSV